LGWRDWFRCIVIIISCICICIGSLFFFSVSSFGHTIFCITIWGFFFSFLSFSWRFCIPGGGNLLCFFCCCCWEDYWRYHACVFSVRTFIDSFFFFFVFFFALDHVHGKWIRVGFFFFSCWRSQDLVMWIFFFFFLLPPPLFFGFGFGFGIKFGGGYLNF
jgi:hypothetical protein